MAPFTRPRIFGISILDDLIVSVIGVLGQVGVVVIMLPILIVVMIVAVTVGVLVFGALAFLLPFDVPAAVTGMLGLVLGFLVPLGVTTLISVRVYRRLPRKLKRVAFEDYDDEVEPGSDAVGAPSGTTPPAPSLAELDARLARRPSVDD